MGSRGIIQTTRWCYIPTIKALALVMSDRKIFSSFSYIGALLKFKFSKKTYLIVIKDETDLKFKMNDSTLFLIGSYAQKLVASY